MTASGAAAVVSSAGRLAVREAGPAEPVGRASALAEPAQRPPMSPMSPAPARGLLGVGGRR